MESENKLLTPEQAAEFFNISEKTLSKWRMKGEGPIYVKLSSGTRSPVRYWLNDLIKYLDEQQTAQNS